MTLTLVKFIRVESRLELLVQHTLIANQIVVSPQQQDNLGSVLYSPFKLPMRLLKILQELKVGNKRDIDGGRS